MRNFKFTLWLFALFMIGWSTQAQNVQIGSGTTTGTTHPISGNWGYSYTQQIYTQAQVSTAGEITKIRFYYVSGTTTSSLDWVIYMGHTTKTSFSSTTDWVPVADMTEVFNGEVTYPAAGNWMEITLATPFVYNNTDNLVIAVDENTAGFSTITWRAFASATNTGIYYRDDDNNPDPLAPPVAGGRSSTLAQVQLYFLESCPGPSNIVFSNIGTDHADVNWTSNGTETQWKIKYGISGFNVETEGTLEDVSSKPHTISSLTANTAYHVYVKADCGGDQSSWVGPVSFRTACEPFDVLPYTESFDTWETGSAAFPLCWTRPVTYTSSSIIYPSCVSANSVSTPNSLRFNSDVGIPTYAVTPAFAEDIHNLMITFSLKASSATSAGNFEIGVMSNPSDVSTFELVKTITSTSTDWTFYEVFLNSTTLSGANNYIAFRQIGNSYTSSYFFLEDVSVELLPSCIKATDLFVDNLTATSASLNWTENGTATNWNIKVSTSATFDPTETGEIFDGVATGNPHAISGLTPNTTYYYYVQANCGSSDLSEWSVKGEFTTKCDINSVFPYTEEFEGTVPPVCWNELRTPTSTYGWSSNSSGVSGKCARFDSYFNSTGNKSSLISETFDISGLFAPVLEFDYKNPTGGDFTVLLSTDGGATYPNTLQTGLTDQTNWTSFTYDLSSYISTGSNVKIALVGTSNYSNGDAYIYVDNFTIREMSDENDILTFSLAEQKSPAVIDNLAKTVEIEVLMNTVLTALTPTIAISNYASITPASGTAQDFLVPFEYTVTSELGTPQIWTVTVTESTTQSSEKDILTFALPGQTGPATIGANTIDIEVGWLSDLSSLTPTITISDFATVSPLSGVAQDFSSPVSYTVTAEDGTTKVYTVSVTLAGAPLGANCTNPFIVSIPTALPYEDLSQTNCGLGNVYQLVDQNYTKGEDAIYRLDVTSNTVVKITMSTSTTYTGLFLFDGCPDTGTILKQVINSGSSDRVITQALTAGTYYLMLDVWPAPDCFAYDLTIETVCPAVTAIQTVNLTATSTDLQWTAGGFETAWNVKVNATSTIDPLTVDGDIVANASVSTAAYSIASGLMPETVYYVYVQANCGSAWTQYMFTTPSACPVPTGLVVSNIDVSTATLSWNEIGVSDWLIKVSTTSLTDPEAETADFANNTAVSGTGTFGLTGLSANTTYYWYVKSACGSAWSTEGEFTTECSAFSVPFAENFAGVLTSELPNCWTQSHSHWSVSESSSAGGTSPELELYWDPSTTGDLKVFLPTIDATSSSDLEMTFMHYVDWYEDSFDLKLQYSIDNGATWNNAWQLANVTSDVSAVQETVDLSPLVGGEIFQLAFVYSGDTYSVNGWYIDNIIISGATSSTTIDQIDINSDVSDISVCLGVSETTAIATLAPQITITDSEDEEYVVDLTWTIDAYDATTPAVYTATGAFTLPTGVFQTSPVTPLAVTANVTVNAPATPTFNFATNYCIGATADALPASSIEGITGTWNATTIATDVVAVVDYVFTADALQCATDATVSVTVHALPVVTCHADFTVTNVTPVTLTSSPAGGTHTGMGITPLGGFSANNLANDDYTITYTYTDATTGCSNSCEFIATVFVPLGAISGIDVYNSVQDLSVCQGVTETDVLAMLTDTITIKDGANNMYVVDLAWTIASFDGNTPANYNATGTFVLPVEVSQTDPTTALEVAATIAVNAPTVPAFSFATEYCHGEVVEALPLTSDNGITGTWNPAIVATDVVVANVDYVFTATTGQCATNKTVTVTVNAPVTPIFDAVGPFCEGSTIAELSLTSTNGIAGTWSPAINNTETTEYTFTPETGLCATTQTLTIVINPNVTPTFDAVGPFCEGSTIAELPLTSTNGIVGTWSPAINNAATTVYTFTPTAGLCATTQTLTIVITPKTIPAFAAVGPFCEGATIAELPLTSTNGIVGTWSPAINNAATTEYTFTPAVGECATTATMSITITPNVAPTFSFETEYCQNADGDALPLTSDNGVTGIWTPATIATNVVGEADYVFTSDAGQCASSPSVTVTVKAIPVVSCPADFTVASIDAVPLTATPEGGTFDGPGVTGNMFTAIDLVDGEYTITYTYTDATTGCSNTCEFVATVDFASSIDVNEMTSIGVYPNPNNGMFTIDFANISGKANYQIYDAKGSIIVNKNIHTSGNTTEDVSLNLVPGVYFIKVVTTNQTIVEKLVIQ